MLGMVTWRDGASGDVDEFSYTIYGMSSRFLIVMGGYDMRQVDEVATLTDAWLIDAARGELSALRRSDIDLVNRTIRVERQLTETSGQGLTVGAPKSAAARFPCSP